jgi:plastocyanin
MVLKFVVGALLAASLNAVADRSVREAASTPSAVGSQAVDTTITIKASGSSLEFTPPNISVKNGKRVKLRFVNDGTLPHNIVLPKSASDLDALATEAYGAGETGYVPVGSKDKLIAYSTLASPGQTVEVTFVVPAPGEYTYVCLFPGHANSMFGTLRSLR